MRDRLLAAYLRLPEHPAKFRLARALGRWVFPADGIVAPINSAGPGVRLHLHPRDWIEYELLRGKPYEPLTLEFLRRNLRAGDTALLAGVNNGLHVIVAAQAVGPRGCVIGVEPQPDALVRARKNIALNGFEGTVRMVAGALGDVSALVPMAWSSPENTAPRACWRRPRGFSYRSCSFPPCCIQRVKGGRCS